jgi:hypothetical protein
MFHIPRGWRGTQPARANRNTSEQTPLEVRVLTNKAGAPAADLPALPLLL